MSRTPWLGRPAGRHAAPPRGRGTGPPVSGAGAASAPRAAMPPAGPTRAAPPEEPPWAAARAPAASPLGAPTMADAPPAPLVSPVTDDARAAVAASAASLPAYVPADLTPLVTIDALGRKCPIPIIMLAQQISRRPRRRGDRRARRRSRRLHRHPGLVRAQVARLRLPRRLRVRLVVRRPPPLLGLPEPVREAGVGLPPGAVVLVGDAGVDGRRAGVVLASDVVRGRQAGRRRAGGVARVEFRVDLRGFLLVRPHHLDELDGEERQADEVAEDPDDAAAENLAGRQARAVGVADRVVVRGRRGWSGPR